MQIESQTGTQMETPLLNQHHCGTVRTNDTIVVMEIETTPDRSRFAVYRDKVRGAPVPPLKECGTYAAARRHQRRKEPLCDACRLVLNERQRELYKRRASQ